LVARAKVLLERGDIGSARIALERAAEAGNPKASFKLAETYDPIILSKWGTYGTRGDATRARRNLAESTKQRSASMRCDGSGSWIWIG
jgi:hypothetical protein